MKLIYSLLLLLFSSTVFAQEPQIKWWNPAENDFKVIEGQAWPDEVRSFYDRLPAAAEDVVRKRVWDLSRNSSGLIIRFKSDAPEILVRYKVKGNIAMPHMPATGVSGVDLYSKSPDGQWMWNKARYSFGDTTSYNYLNIKPNEKYHKRGKEYQLYLPLYNSVDWLEIGTPDGSLFEPLPLRQEKPIVVYGTSIAQGACASRPGMAWTSILQRKLDRPMVNLAFSGNGRLEPEMIDYLSDIDAKLYILDCLPNLGPTKDRSLENVYERIISSVRTLKSKRPSVPILLTEHGGYSDGATNMARQETFTSLNDIMRKAFLQLEKEGIQGLHILPIGEIGLSIDSFVDGTHPSDLGMIEYARAYENKVRYILNERQGGYSTTIPVTQAREPGSYSWEQRHQELLKINKQASNNIAFFGNSITHYWGGIPAGPIKRGEASWAANFEALGVQNFGFGWDRIENTLWRVYHDELDNFTGDQVVLMLGTNNLGLNTDMEIIEGLKNLVEIIQSKKPDVDVLLLGILPRRAHETRIVNLNKMIAQIGDITKTNYQDVGTVFLKDGKIEEALFTDGLHPNSKGYDLLAKEITKHLNK
jgi:lysophospholipase L1-like esterase